MFEPNNNWRELYAPSSDTVSQPEPDRDWTEIAEELVNEKDAKKVLKLTEQLIDALHKRKRAV